MATVLDELERLFSNPIPKLSVLTPGKNGNLQIWCDYFPIGEVTRGKWGDDYPAIRLAEGQGLQGMFAEAYMEQITYGEVSDENAKRIADALVAAYNALPSLLAAARAAANPSLGHAWNCTALYEDRLEDTECTCGLRAQHAALAPLLKKVG